MMLPDALAARHQCQSQYRGGKDLRVVVGTGQPPYILAMDEKDVLERLGPRDKIIGRGERTRSRVLAVLVLQAHDHKHRANPGSSLVSGVRRRRVRDS
jgi:hypothetical protein